jgi:hypothetical protein
MRRLMGKCSGEAAPERLGCPCPSNYFPIGDAVSQASSTSTISAISQSRSVTFAAIAALGRRHEACEHEACE